MSFEIDKKELLTQIKQKGYVKLAKELHIGKTTLFRKMKEYNLTTKQKPWTTTEKEIIKKYYFDGTKLFSLLPQRTPCAIYHIAHKMKIHRHVKPRKYTLNTKFFSKFNPTSSYVLGWLYSDGNITKDLRTARLHLQKKDVTILKKIKCVMNSNQPIYYNANAVELKLHSTLMVKTLRGLGCVERKSKKITFPKNIPKRYHRAFIRGYFDGDGSIMFNKPNTIKVNFSGNRKFIEQLNKIINADVCIPIAKLIENRKKEHSSVWMIYFYGDNARKLCKWMYQDSNRLYLNRKHDRYIRHLRLRGEKI
jgi:hypothetical protein